MLLFFVIVLVRVVEALARGLGLGTQEDQGQKKGIQFTIIGYRLGSIRQMKAMKIAAGVVAAVGAASVFVPVHQNLREQQKALQSPLNDQFKAPGFVSSISTTRSTSVYRPFSDNSFDTESNGPTLKKLLYSERIDATFSSLPTCLQGYCFHDLSE